MPPIYKSFFQPCHIDPWALNNKESFHDELVLKTTLKENGYFIKQIRHGVNLAVRTSESKDKTILVALPYVQSRRSGLLLRNGVVL